MPAHPQPHCRRIAAGERLLLLSDGVLDRATLDGGTLGLDGILDAVRKAPAESAAGTLRAIEDAVREASTDPSPTTPRSSCSSRAAPPRADGRIEFRRGGKCVAMRFRPGAPLDAGQVQDRRGGGGRGLAVGGGAGGLILVVSWLSSASTSRAVRIRTRSGLRLGRAR